MAWTESRCRGVNASSSFNSAMRRSTPRLRSGALARAHDGLGVPAGPDAVPTTAAGGRAAVGGADRRGPTAAPPGYSGDNRGDEPPQGPAPRATPRHGVA